MNSKAEKFKAYLDEKEIKVFEIEELQDDAQHTAVFRSYITAEGQQLPTLVIIDDSIFTLVRVRVSPKAMTEQNQLAILKMTNEETASYKPFKLYVNRDGDLMLDVCMEIDGDELKGDDIYTIFQVIINYLNDNYRRIMKNIWQGD